MCGDVVCVVRRINDVNVLVLPMTKNVDAIYEDGAFRPIQSEGLTLANGARVRLTIEQVKHDNQPDVLNLAANVYAGLSHDDVVEIEKIALERTDFFGR